MTPIHYVSELLPGGRSYWIIQLSRYDGLREMHLAVSCM